MADQKVLRSAFEAALALNLRAITLATLLQAHGGDGQLETPNLLDGIPEERLDELLETLVDLMPRGSVFVDLWDYDVHFELELGDQWLLEAALGSPDSESTVAGTLVDLYRQSDERYGIDAGVHSPEELEEYLGEEALSFVRSWRAAVINACLPVELTARECRGPEES